MDVVRGLNKIGLLPYINADRAEASEIAGVLTARGVESMLFINCSQANMKAAKAIRKEYPQMIIGAKVESPQDIRSATGAGLDFAIVEAQELITVCIQNNLPAFVCCKDMPSIEEALEHKHKLLAIEMLDAPQKALELHEKDASLSLVALTSVQPAGIEEIMARPGIIALGGDWLLHMCEAHGKADENCDIIDLVIDRILNFKYGHLGMNCKNKEVAAEITETLIDAFHLPVRYEIKSNFVDEYLEVVNNIGPGRFGHIAIKTNNIERAIHYTHARGYEIEPASSNYRENGELFAIYLKIELEGFNVHLLQA